MTRIFVIVRHGNTFTAGETPRRIGARTDLPLVESGRAQAARLGDEFAARGWRFDRIFSSPLMRTRETADIIRISSMHAPPVDVSRLLAEIDHGVDENQPEDVVIARIGATALSAWDTDGIAPAGWHVDRAVRIAGWQAQFTEPGGNRRLFVTSNGAARFALLADPRLMAQAQAQGLPSLRLRTGAFGVVRATDTGLHLDAWNVRL